MYSHPFKWQPAQQNEMVNELLYISNDYKDFCKIIFETEYLLFYLTQLNDQLLVCVRDLPIIHRSHRKKGLQKGAKVNESYPLWLDIDEADIAKVRKNRLKVALIKGALRIFGVEGDLDEPGSGI